MCIKYQKDKLGITITEQGEKHFVNLLVVPTPQSKELRGMKQFHL
jgi:hypothetical protein